MNKVRGPRDPPSQWPPGLRFRDKEICSPRPYSSQRGLFPLLYPSPPNQHQDLHRTPAGRPPPRLAFSTTERGDELRKSEQVNWRACLGLRGLGRAHSLHPSEVGAPGLAPTPALPNLRSLTPIGSHLLPRIRGSSRTGCLCEVLSGWPTGERLLEMGTH